MDKIKQYLEMQARVHGESDIKQLMQEFSLDIPIAAGTKDRLEFTQARLRIAEYLLSQAHLIYYVTLNYNNYEELFIGVFSSHEKAANACQAHHDEVHGSDYELEFKPIGDAVRAYGESGWFTIMLIELDNRIQV